MAKDGEQLSLSAVLERINANPNLRVKLWADEATAELRLEYSNGDTLVARATDEGGLLLELHRVTIHPVVAP